MTIMALVKISPKGHILIPKKIRDKYGVIQGGKVQLIEGPDGILVKPAPEDPIEAACGFIEGDFSLNTDLLEERLKDKKSGRENGRRPVVDGPKLRSRNGGSASIDPPYNIPMGTLFFVDVEPDENTGSHGLVAFGAGDSSGFTAFARAKGLVQVYLNRHGVTLDFNFYVLHGDPPLKKSKNISELWFQPHLQALPFQPIQIDKFEPFQAFSGQLIDGASIAGDRGQGSASLSNFFPEFF
jgi:AbrB family looped-hinge helix DNA binding protein